MCKIILVINKNPKNNATIQDLISANIEKLKEEEDGYSVFRDTKTYYFMTEKAYTKMDQNLKYNGEELYIIHTRTSTGGAHDIEGLHLQTIMDNYIFAHNGTVGKYSSVRTKSDSYYFFKHLLKKYPKINASVIEDFAKQTNFSGKGVLYNKKEKELHYFCNLASYITVLDDALIISSYELDTIKTIYKENTVLGFTWREDEETEEIKGILHDEKIDDCYLLFKNGKVVEREPIKTRDYGGTSWNYQKEQTEKEEVQKMEDEEYIEELIKEGYTRKEAESLALDDRKFYEQHSVN